MNDIMQLFNEVVFDIQLLGGGPCVCKMESIAV